MNLQDKIKPWNNAELMEYVDSEAKSNTTSIGDLRNYQKCSISTSALLFSKELNAQL